MFYLLQWLAIRFKPLQGKACSWAGISFDLLDDLYRILLLDLGGGKVDKSLKNYIQGWYVVTCSQLISTPRC